MARLGLDDSNLSQLIGIHRNTIANWRHRGNAPSLIAVIKMAALFECDIEDLVVVKEG